MSVIIWAGMLSAQFGTHFGWSLAVGVTIAFGKISGSGETRLVCDFTYGFIGGNKQRPPLLQTQTPHEFNRSIVGKSLDFAVELRALEPHT